MTLGIHRRSFCYLYDENHLINVIQPNIKQEIKWKKNLKLEHHQKLINISKLKHDDDLLSILNVWTETAFLGVYPRNKSLIQDMSQIFLNPTKNEFLFTGTISNYKNNYYNSALLLNSKKELKDIYSKNVLVPFGEYLPFRKILSRFHFFENKIDFSRAPNVGEHTKEVLENMGYSDAELEDLKEESAIYWPNKL